MAATIVRRLDAEAGRRLYDELGRGSFAFRRVDHAHWGAKGEDASVVWYRSGKLVVQGKGAETFANRYLAGAQAVPTKGTPAPPEALTVPTIGSDESGKGDYFGPLTVAAALVQPEALDTLAELGVQDSKQATDGHVRKVEGLLRETTLNADRVLEPEAYNEAYAEVRNLNRLLGRLHAEVIDAVLLEARSEGLTGRVRIVVDRFGDSDHVRCHLSEDALQQPFVMRAKAESNPAVAAASFLARATFLQSFERLRGLAGGELYMGASDPRILPLARRMVAEGGEAWLGQFAKLHFKVTQRAL